MFNPFAILLDFIYSSSCEICKGPLRNMDRVICGNCWNQLKYWDPRVPVRFFALEEAGIVPSFNKVKVIYQFLSPCRELIHLLKYERRPSIGKKLGISAGRVLTEDPDYSQADLLVPVPLHPVKLRERGYNQALLLVQAIGQVTRIPYRPNLLKRLRYTESQTKLDFSERRKNVTNLFTVLEKDLIRNKSVIVVDDVITSGSTLDACGKIILESGAAQVLGVAITHPTRQEDMTFI